MQDFILEMCIIRMFCMIGRGKKEKGKKEVKLEHKFRTQGMLNKITKEKSTHLLTGPVGWIEEVRGSRIIRTGRYTITAHTGVTSLVIHEKSEMRYKGKSKPGKEAGYSCVQELAIKWNGCHGAIFLDDILFELELLPLEEHSEERKVQYAKLADSGRQTLQKNREKKEEDQENDSTGKIRYAYSFPDEERAATIKKIEERSQKFAEIKRKKIEEEEQDVALEMERQRVGPGPDVYRDAQGRINVATGPSVEPLPFPDIGLDAARMKAMRSLEGFDDDDDGTVSPPEKPMGIRKGLRRAKG